MTPMKVPVDLASQMRFQVEIRKYSVKPQASSGMIKYAPSAGFVPRSASGSAWLMRPSASRRV